MGCSASIGILWEHAVDFDYNLGNAEGSTASRHQKTRERGRRDLGRGEEEKIISSLNFKSAWLVSAGSDADEVVGRQVVVDRVCTRG